MGLILIFMVGLTPYALAQDVRTMLVVNPHGHAFYSADDLNQLQSALLPFRKQYGIAVQGFDQNMGGYLVFSSRTKLEMLTADEMKQLQDAIRDLYPNVVFVHKTQQPVNHKPQSEKIGSSEAGKNRNPKLYQPKK
jgi:hypothetical protein